MRGRNSGKVGTTAAVFRYCICAVVSLAGADSAVVRSVGWYRDSVLSASLIFSAAIMVYVCSQGLENKCSSVHMAAQVVVWSVIGLFVTFMIFTISSVAFGWPQIWVSFLGLQGK